MSDFTGWNFAHDLIPLDAADRPPSLVVVETTCSVRVVPSALFRSLLSPMPTCMSAEQSQTFFETAQKTAPASGVRSI